MTSNTPPSYADLSHLYTALNRQPTTTTTVPCNTSLTAATSASSSSPAAERALLVQQQLLNCSMDDPRAAAILAGLGTASASSYEEEIARQLHKSRLLRRYNELNQQLAAAGISTTATTNTLAAVAGVGASSSILDHSLMRLQTLGGGGPQRASSSLSTAFGMLNAAPTGSSSSSSTDEALTHTTRQQLLAAQQQQQQRGLGVIGSAYSAFHRTAQDVDVDALMDVPAVNHQQQRPKDLTPELEDEEAFFQNSVKTKERFPVKLYRMLHEQAKEGRESVVSFLPHGKAFAIHDEATFVKDVMPRYFANCQLPSFQKQLNLYGFHKITVGKDKGKLRYFHASFRKGRPSLSNKIQRRRTTGGAANAKRK